MAKAKTTIEGLADAEDFSHKAFFLGVGLGLCGALIALEGYGVINPLAQPPLNVQDVRAVIQQMKSRGVDAHVTVYSNENVYVWLDDLKAFGRSNSLEGALADLHAQGIDLAKATEPRP